MRELAQKRIMALIGVLIAAVSTSPFATNLALLGKSGFDAIVAGVAGAAFLVGLVLALSIFQKQK